MDWRLRAFVIGRRAQGHPARLAAVLVTLALAAGSASAWVATRPVTLTVTVPAGYLATGTTLHVAVVTSDRPVAGDDLVGDGRTPATFRLPRGEYTVQLSMIDENGVTLLLAPPVPIHLARDEALAVGVGLDETLVSPLFPPAPSDD